MPANDDPMISHVELVNSVLRTSSGISTINDLIIDVAKTLFCYTDFSKEKNMNEVAKKCIQKAVCFAKVLKETEPELFDD